MSNTVTGVAINRVKNERLTAIVLLVLTAAFWSLGGVLIKWVSWNPIAIAGGRSAIGAILLLFVIKKPAITWSFPQIGGAIAYAGTVILFVCANKMTTAANAILLQYTAPIYIALFGAWFLKEKARLKDWITIVFVFAGMILFFFDDLSAGGMWGNILAILSGLCFAFLAMFLRMQKDGSPLESVFLGNILTALIGLPFMFQSVPDTKGWIGLALLGTLQLGLPYILYSKAIKQVTAMEALLIPVIEPVLNPIWVFLAMGEIPGIWSFAGGIVVLISVTVRCMSSSFEKKV